MRTFGEVLLFNKFFFRLSIRALVAKIWPDKVAMVPRWRFLRPVFSASRVQYISDMHSKFALRIRIMCGSMVDIQCPTAEIRGGKKKKQDKNIISASATQGGHKKSY